MRDFCYFQEGLFFAVFGGFKKVFYAILLYRCCTTQNPATHCSAVDGGVSFAYAVVQGSGVKAPGFSGLLECGILALLFTVMDVDTQSCIRR